MFCRVVMWPLLSGHVLLDDVGERLHLLRRDAAERQLHADHLDVGLALAVDALLERKPMNSFSGVSPGEELLGLVVEVVELALEDRDDVPGTSSRTSGLARDPLRPCVVEGSIEQKVPRGDSRSEFIFPNPDPS
jgi:hypothetical protein